jgi:hypothetical protein
MKLWACDSPRILDHFRASRPSELFLEPSASRPTSQQISRSYIPGKPGHYPARVVSYTSTTSQP